MAYTGSKVLFHYNKKDLLTAIESNSFNKVDKNGLDFIQKIIKNEDCSLITLNILEQLVEKKYDLFKEEYSVYFHSNEVIQFAIKKYHPNELEEYEAKKIAEKESEVLKGQFSNNKIIVKTRL